MIDGLFLCSKVPIDLWSWVVGSNKNTITLVPSTYRYSPGENAGSENLEL